MKRTDALMRAVFLACACVCIAAASAICLFLLVNSVPALREIGFFKFISGRRWKPSAGQYGIFPMIAASAYVTAGAVAFGVPLGVLTAVFLDKYCPAALKKPLRAAVNLLAGIPSVVYGFFALSVIVPALRRLTGTGGKGILAASVLLAVMILPTVTSTCESALRSVPQSYFEGSLALGATRERSIFRCVFPAAAPGILSGIILGMGRAAGETMAVVMVAGNQAVMPSSVTSGVRTLTANIVLEMGYAAGLHRDALIATAAVLFVFMLIINLCFSCLRGGGEP